MGSILPIGQLWVTGSRLDHLLVSLPCPYGPKFEHLVLPDRHIRFMWLMPISSAEAAYAQERGVEALEQRLEERTVDSPDPVRPEVA